MPYIVPDKIPESCCYCPFGYCRFNNPFWVEEKPNISGYMCVLDKEHRILEMDYNDRETTKAEWCPLREVKTIKTRVTMDGGKENA